MSLFGLGYRPVHYSQVISERPKVDFFEIISENFMAVGGNPKKKLHELRAYYPVAMHGVSLSVAGTAPLDFNYLSALKELAASLDPMIVSDHLCFTTDEKGRQVYDLLPIPYNKANLSHVISRVNKIQDFLGRQLVLENPSSYVAWKSSEMHEDEFLHELCHTTGAGVLLDLNNLIVNQKNLGIDPHRYFNTLKHHVKQFHIAGHKLENGFAIDTHDQPVGEAVWSLLKIAKSFFPDAPILLEWDDHIPNLNVLCEELNKARHLRKIDPLEFTAIPQSNARSRLSLNFAPSKKITIERHELTDSIFYAEKDPKIKPQDVFLNDTPLVTRAGLQIYKNAYFSRIKSALKESCPILYYIAEDIGLNAITKFYLNHETKGHWSLNNIGRSLVEILKKDKVDFDFGVEQALITELAVVDNLINESFLSIDDNSLSPDNLREMVADDIEIKKFGITFATRFFVAKWDIVPLIEHIFLNQGKENHQVKDFDSIKNESKTPDPERSAQVSPSVPALDPKLVVITRQNNQTRVSGFSIKYESLLKKLEEPRLLKEVISSDDLNAFKFFVSLVELGAIKET